MTGPSTYVVSREARVSAAPSAVLDRITDFRRWTAWSPWEELDPDLRRTYSGPDSGVGAAYEWSGNRKAGQGRMEIVDVGAETVTIDLRFLKPFKSTSKTVFTVRPDGDATKVTWTMTGQKTFLTRVMGIFASMDKMIGPDFEKGLARLKADAETGAG